MKNGKKIMITADANLGHMKGEGDLAALTILALSMLDDLIRHDPHPDADLNIYGMCADFFSQQGDDERHAWIEKVKGAYRMAHHFSPVEDDDPDVDVKSEGTSERKLLIQADERLENLTIRGDRSGLILLAALAIDQALKNPRFPENEDAGLFLLRKFFGKIHDEDARYAWLKDSSIAYRCVLGMVDEKESKNEQTDSEI